MQECRQRRLRGGNVNSSFHICFLTEFVVDMHVDGGLKTLSHLVGATGARCVATSLHEMKMW